MDLIEFLPNEFATCSKSSRRGNYRKVSRVRVESRACDHGRCKNDAILLLATLQTNHLISDEPPF